MLTDSILYGSLLWWGSFKSLFVYYLVWICFSDNLILFCGGGDNVCLFGLPFASVACVVSHVHVILTCLSKIIECKQQQIW